MTIEKTNEALQEEIQSLKATLEKKEKAFQSALQLGRITGWIGLCWNDHNFRRAPEEYARIVLEKLNLKDLDKFNDFMEGLETGSGIKIDISDLENTLLLKTKPEKLMDKTAVEAILVKHEVFHHSHAKISDRLMSAIYEIIKTAITVNQFSLNVTVLEKPTPPPGRVAHEGTFPE